MTIAAGPTDCSSGLALRIFAALKYDNPWAAGVTYVVGVNGCPTVPNGFGYQVSAVTTGVSGGSEPTWPLVINNTVTDGGVTWQCIEVANPSGKGANAPGYAYTGTDLNALRFLAYNTAKAVEASLNTDKVDGGTQLSGTVTPTGGCSAIYNTNVSQALGVGATTINFATKEVDTDNAVSVGTAWKFTCPAGKGGTYHVSASAGIGPVVTANSDTLLIIRKTGYEAHRGSRLPAIVGNYYNFVGSADVVLAAGDTIDITIYTGVAQTLDGVATGNRVCIHRIPGL